MLNSKRDLCLPCCWPQRPIDYRSSNTIALTAGMMAPWLRPAEAQERAAVVLQNEKGPPVVCTKPSSNVARPSAEEAARASAGVVRGLVHRKALLVHLMFEALDDLASEHRMCATRPAPFAVATTLSRPESQRSKPWAGLPPRGPAPSSAFGWISPSEPMQPSLSGEGDSSS